jgi:hypothetical protein
MTGGGTLNHQHSRVVASTQLLPAVGVTDSLVRVRKEGRREERGERARQGGHMAGE